MQSEEIRQLEADLERKKEDIREDLTKIQEKVRVTRTELSPSKLMSDRLFLLSGLAMLLGFAIGYDSVQVNEIFKPAARSVLTAAGKEAAARAFRG
jgi:hypothetical protein